MPMPFRLQTQQHALITRNTRSNGVTITITLIDGWGARHLDNHAKLQRASGADLDHGMQGMGLIRSISSERKLQT